MMFFGGMLIGFVIGGIFGVTIMCILQINR